MRAKSDFFLFDGQLLPWLLLAFGAAMVVGNLAALVRPPAPEPGELGGRAGERPPLGRTLVLVIIGAVAAIWAVASLVRG
jgi:hypothetical protein